MNKYVIPICNIPENKVYNLVINAHSMSECKDKIVTRLNKYSDFIEYDDFVNDLDKKDIMIGKIQDVDEL